VTPRTCDTLYCTHYESNTIASARCRIMRMHSYSVSGLGLAGVVECGEAIISMDKLTRICRRYFTSTSRVHTRQCPEPRDNGNLSDRTSITAALPVEGVAGPVLAEGAHPLNTFCTLKAINDSTVVPSSLPVAVMVIGYRSELPPIASYVIS
jgi:hypothetical protein